MSDEIEDFEDLLARTKFSPEADRFKWVRPYVAHVMDHNTTTPEQAQTDKFAVRVPGSNSVEKVDVPRYSSPDSGAERLDEWEQKELAAFLSNVDTDYAEVCRPLDSEYSTVHVHDNHPTFRAIEEAHDL